ncbi:MAG TPA: AzlD domain-containing protein [Acidimicrobiia bacterium]|nr:AzlD domain-containing protein [Acidimicrobiia bacterium]
MTTFMASVVVGIGTYASRAIFILALAKRRIPDTVMISLQFVAPAVLSALVIAVLSNDDGTVALGIPEIAAFIAGGATVYRTRNHILTLVVGMTVFWVVRALV